MVLLEQADGYILRLTPNDIEAWAKSVNGKRFRRPDGTVSLSGHRIQVTGHSFGMGRLVVDGVLDGGGARRSELMLLVAWHLRNANDKVKEYWPIHHGTSGQLSNFALPEPDEEAHDYWPDRSTVTATTTNPF